MQVSDVPWFKVDDNLAFHAKVLAAGNDAMGLWVRAGSWCAQQLTDGVVPTHLVSVLGTPKQARRLVEAGLWETHQQGFAFHGWIERQPTRDEVETKREQARERMAQVRASRGKSVRANTERTTSESSDEVTLTPTRPDPTRPDPKVPTEPSLSAQKRGTRLSPDFMLTEDMKLWAKENAPNANLRDHERFMDHWPAQPGAKGVKLDWIATWRNWMRKSSDDRDAAPKASFAPAKPSSQPEIYEDENGVYKRRWK